MILSYIIYYTTKSLCCQCFFALGTILSPSSDKYLPIFQALWKNAYALSRSIKQKRPTSSDAFISFFNSDCSLNLTGAKAACADVNGGVGSVNNCFNLSYVRLPHSACFSVGVGNIVTKSNSFLTEFALCHLKLPSSKINQVHHDTKSADRQLHHANLCIRLYHSYYIILFSKLQ